MIYFKPMITTRTHALAIVLIVLGLVPVGAWSASYETSNAGIQNVQASSPTSGGATDKNGNCVFNASYSNHHSESWIALDPTNASHLVGMSKFFFDPAYYLFHIGSHNSFDGGQTWKNEVVPGFDCHTAPGFSWVNTTDPILAFDDSGVVYSAMLPYSLTYNPQGKQVWNVIPNSAISVVKSIDGGLTWMTANQGKPVAIYNSSGLGRTADKQWMTADANPKATSPFAGNVYIGFTLFNGHSSELWFSRSTDHGEHFTQPVKLSEANNDGPFNTYIFLAAAPEGTLYISYSSFPNSQKAEADVWILKSADGGQTFSGPTLAVRFPILAALPNTTFRDGISYNMTVNPANGHVLLALEVQNTSGVDVQLSESIDGGQTFSPPVFVNDSATVNDGTDQFQPTVAAGPDGTVAVAFYDRRLACPMNDPNILPADQGQTNFCIDTSIQFFSDARSGLSKLGSNIRVTRASWDPQNPGTNSDGLPLPGGPTTATTFIGDYFGLGLSSKSAFALFVSNYNFGENTDNDQQQFLGIVPIPSN